MTLHAGILPSLMEGLKTDWPRDEGMGMTGISEVVSPFLFSWVVPKTKHEHDEEDYLH